MKYYNKDSSRFKLDDQDDFFSKKSSVLKIKTQKLCKQIMRSLSVSILGHSHALIRDLHILSVEPAPDHSRLLVLLGTYSQDTIMQSKQILNAYKASLRFDIGKSIHRKKVPEIYFDIIYLGQAC